MNNPSAPMRGRISAVLTASRVMPTPASSGHHASGPAEDVFFPLRLRGRDFLGREKVWELMIRAYRSRLGILHAASCAHLIDHIRNSGTERLIRIPPPPPSAGEGIEGGPYLAFFARCGCGAQVGKEIRGNTRDPGMLAADQKGIGNRAFVRFLALVQTAVAALAALIVGDGLEEMDAAKIGP